MIDIAQISGISDTGSIRVVLFRDGQLIHAPLSAVLEYAHRLDTYTATQIADASHAVNTTGKANGSVVKDTTNNRIMIASGSTANAAWHVSDGSASVTPS